MVLILCLVLGFGFAMFFVLPDEVFETNIPVVTCKNVNESGVESDFFVFNASNCVIKSDVDEVWCRR
jgi:hypothetical protein